MSLVVADGLVEQVLVVRKPGEAPRVLPTARRTRWADDV
jgi:hypothetical protein